MSNDTQTAPAIPSSLQGVVFECLTEQDRLSAIEKAFDYRGDITLDLINGTKIEGYLFNRDNDAHPPRVELFVKGSEQPTIVPYSDIHAVAFTGNDPATGKSWRDWVAKKESERKAEAERIKAEAISRGEL
jgi:hypothetical protein